MQTPLPLDSKSGQKNFSDRTDDDLSVPANFPPSLSPVFLGMRVRCDVVGVSVGRRSAGVWSPVGSGFRAILNSGLSLFARRDASCRLFAMMIGYPARFLGNNTLVNWECIYIQFTDRSAGTGAAPRPLTEDADLRLRHNYGGGSAATFNFEEFTPVAGGSLL